ncbi:MAG: cyclopropane fatty acyl phospholipid synthase [Desulfopila sp.]
MATMIEDAAKRYVSNLLTTAGIEVNGSKPWDIHVKTPKFFPRIVTGGSLALGESYMDGWWDCEALDVFFFKLLRRKLDRKVRLRGRVIANTLKAIILNCQSRRKAHEVGEQHYDAGNDLFEVMLDSKMVYSCGYWKDANELNEAQRAKLDMICRKLRLEPGMKLLDIGCGWGSLVEYAARRYGVEAVGLTISRNQAELAKQRCKGLPVEIRLEDYRKVSGSYDAVVSVGMFEHVGYKNYEEFMEVVRGCLDKDGLFLLHTIASNATVRNCDPWFDKYIFPNGMLPSIKLIGSAVEERFVMEDWQNLGAYYDHTLMSWYQNFENNWHTLKERYSDKFYRMWRYYLLSVAGAFRARNMQVWQVMLSPEGIPGGYQALRCQKCLEE